MQLPLASIRGWQRPGAGQWHCEASRGGHSNSSYTLVSSCDVLIVNTLQIFPQLQPLLWCVPPTSESLPKPRMNRTYQ